MTTVEDSSTLENNYYSSNSPWKPTPFGHWARYDEVIEYDPSLIEIIKPIDKFEGFSDEFKFKVKINADGSIVVFRSNRFSNNGNGGYDDKKQLNRLKDFGKTKGPNNYQFYVDHLLHTRKKSEYKINEVRGICT